MEEQFLLVVKNERGFPKFQLMHVATNYDTINDPNFGSAGSSGGGTSLSLSLTEPNGTPFSFSVAE